jgi:hypothetical protein
LPLDDRLGPEPKLNRVVATVRRLDLRIPLVRSLRRRSFPERPHMMLTPGRLPADLRSHIQEVREVDVAESALHLTMKANVAAELSSQGYSIYEEPLHPPTSRLSWFAYRPDLLGVRVTDGAEEFVFVECETKPRTRRISSKNLRSVGLQSSLFRAPRLKKILVIPRGRLRAVDRELRTSWEIWLASDGGFYKIPHLGADQ